MALKKDFDLEVHEQYGLNVGLAVKGFGLDPSLCISFNAFGILLYLSSFYTPQLGTCGLRLLNMKVTVLDHLDVSLHDKIVAKSVIKQTLKSTSIPAQTHHATTVDLCTSCLLLTGA